MSTVVAGADFGTLSVRVSLVDSERGPIGSGTAEYPLHRKKEDPDFATQRHVDHMEALVSATHKALAAAGVKGEQVAAIALDTTGSSVVPVNKSLQPIDDYYLWCDHRAWKEAAQITDTARSRGVKAIDWCGGVYSSEWGFAKLLHWLRNNPEKRKDFATTLEHCDMVAATLTGGDDLNEIPRSVCAMGHKWMWNRAWGGFPDNDFLKAVDPLLDGIAAKMPGRFETSDHIAGTLAVDWAEKLGLRAGLPIPVGAFDAHWDTIGAGARLHDLVNVVGTSTCIVGISDSAELVPGVCGVVPGSVHPKFTGIEAGLSATGDIFEAIARRAQISLPELSKKIEKHRAGQTGLLRLTWDNGDRTVLVNPELGGVTLGWKLTHGPEDELFAAIEGTGFHTRVILERMEQHGITIRRVINGGGIPRKNRQLNQIYADILNKPVLVPEGDVTSLGSAIFAFLAAGTFSSLEKAQDALCRKFTVFEPEQKNVAVYAEIYPLYRKLYFSLGQKQAPPALIGEVLPELRRISSAAWNTV